MTERVLELSKISAAYNGLRVLHDVDIHIDKGEIVALMGPNGAGKSTVLKVLFGLLAATDGDVVWHTQRIMPVPYEMVARGVAFVPQGRRVFRHLSVRENLEMGIVALRQRAVLDDRLAGALELFPALIPKLKTASGLLSGGQQQMVALARALMTDPKVLLLDEPSLGLAPKVVAEVFAAVRAINERRGTAIVVVEHNLKSLLEIAQRGYVLDKGHIVAEGAARELAAGATLERVFLGVDEQSA